MFHVRNVWRRFCERQARKRGRHERVLVLLRDELYGDFTRGAAAIYLDIALELATLGRNDEAMGALKMADPARLDEPQRQRLVALRQEIALGKKTTKAVHAGKR